MQTPENQTGAHERGKGGVKWGWGGVVECNSAEVEGGMLGVEGTLRGGCRGMDERRVH